MQPNEKEKEVFYTNSMILYTKKLQEGGLPTGGGVYKVPARKGSILLKGETAPSTHLFANEDNYAFPTLFQNKDGNWVQPKREDVWKEAVKRKEVYKFLTPEDAAKFAEGSWKPKIPHSDLPDIKRLFNL
jgi:hypothetical protein